MCKSHLALLGGKPSFAEPLHVGRPNIGDRKSFMRRMEEIMDRRWFTNDGPVVKEFEREIEGIVGVKHCIAMCNATVALEIAIRALGLKGEVIVPAYTFVATAHALHWQEVTPVFADIDPVSHTIDLRSIERLITPRTTGIIGVHLWGRACDTAGIEKLAARHGLTVMYDAAHAFGCSHRGRKIGGFGACEVFSFHATKFLNSFEGGAIVTNNDELAGKLRLMRNFGFHGYDNVIYIGTNGKMTEVCAAMGLTGLKAMPQFVAANKRNYEDYRRHIDNLSGLNLLAYDSSESSNYQYIVVEVDRAKVGLTRDQLIEVLHRENVLARRYFWPGCHKMQPYRALFPNAGLLLEQTERVAERVMVLPTGTAVDSGIIATICGILEAALATPSAVRAACLRTNTSCE